MARQSEQEKKYASTVLLVLFCFFSFILLVLQIILYWRFIVLSRWIIFLSCIVELND
jgi:hypothetical protein